MSKLHLALLAAALAASPAATTPALAQGGSNPGSGNAGPLAVGTQTGGSGTVPKPDTGAHANTEQPPGAGAPAFIWYAAQSDMADAEASKLALQRSPTQAVRQYAAQLIRDHEKSSDRLHKIALREAIAVPEHLDDARAKKLDELRQASGQDFDAKYLKMAADDHKGVIQFYTNYANDPNGDYHLRDFAADELPVLKTHAELLQQVQSGQG